jgi:hypothetical protein
MINTDCVKIKNQMYDQVEWKVYDQVWWHRVSIQVLDKLEYKVCNQVWWEVYKGVWQVLK